MTDQESIETSYNEIPYASYAHHHAHVRHVEAVATLLDVKPRPIPTCRVLELGCASGGNLIPQAVDLPEAQFVGLDLSRRQVEDGRKTIEALGIGNIELRKADILEVDGGWGEFDYILCHGVFSWVPPEVRDKILEVFSRNLSPNGVALVSYNTYPGWHLRGIVRDFMNYHASRFEDPEKRIEQAKAVVPFVIDLVSEGTSNSDLLKAIFTQEKETLSKIRNDSYVYHEFLESYNQPLYFHEVVKMAEAKGLQYLTDAKFGTTVLQHCSKKIRDALSPLQQIDREQYLDFLTCRRFRSSLLCREGVAVNRSIPLERMRQFHVTVARATNPPTLEVTGPKKARLVQGNSHVDVDSELGRAALELLDEARPGYLSLATLQASALARASSVTESPEQTFPLLASLMLVGFSTELLEICVHPPRLPARLGSHPVASPLARVQAQGSDCVTNGRHEIVALDGLCRHVVRRLDGSHDRNALVSSVRKAVNSGEIAVAQNGKPVAKLNGEVAAHLVDQALSRMSAWGLMVD